MTRTLRTAAIGVLSTALCAACADTSAPASEAARETLPLFTNGGFEVGDFSSWTKTTNLNNTGLLAVPPVSVADLQLAAGGRDLTFVRNDPTPESQLPAGLIAGIGVPLWPRFGLNSAVINEYGAATLPGDSFHQGANRNVNSIKQSMATTWADADPDGRVHIRFVLTPILQAAGHVAAQQPYFFVIIRNTTRGGATLYSEFNFANQTGVPWVSQGAGAAALLFTPWVIFDVVPDDTAFTVGDVVEVEVFAAGCQPGGHSGSVYVDGFGAQLPSLAISKLAPTRANIDTDITYTFTVRNNTSGIAPTVVADEVLPPNTTFVSYSAPGATCTAPSVGQPGTVSCTYGWMNPGASANFTVTVHNFTPTTQGTVTGATTARIDDSTQAWTANAYQGWTAYITDGLQAGQQSVITTNTATRLNLSPVLPGIPANGSGYKVINAPAWVGQATAGNGTTITKSGAASWSDNQWAGWNVVILSGNGAVSTQPILSNTSSVLTVGAWGNGNPNGTSVFAITKPVSSVVNGNYGVAGGTVTRLLGPKRETLIGVGNTFADLSVTKSDGTPALVWGSPTTYTIVVANAGPSAVTNAVVADTIPAQLTGATWTCAGTGGGTCTASGAGNINQNVNLPLGASVTFTVSASVIAGAGSGSVTNVATVTAPAGVIDVFPANNASNDTNALATTLRLLTVNKDPTNTGTGTVTSAPPAINCGTACTTASSSFGDGQSVTLTAVATPTHTFLGWSGDCSGTAATCTVSMTAARNVTVRFTTCGNGTREGTEGCDDGNLLNGDGCNSSCLVETTFACNASAPGSTGSASCASGVCDAVGNAAPGVCEPANTCGNGSREAGEGCDDGNTTAGDGCNATCLVENTRACNGSAPGLTGNSSCASGVCDTVGNAAPGVCEAASTCGNGVREAGEGCDDGNMTAGDGCNATCRIETTRACNASAPGLTGNASCASGVCDTVGNAAPGVCEAVNACGNGVREAGEGCDDGNTTAGDGCNATCLVENTRACNASAPGLTGNSSCASGVCDTVGNAAPGVCEAVNACGNGVREAGEGCDDGNTTAGDGCNATCRIETTRACNASAPGLTGNASCASGVCDTVGNAAPGVCEAVNACGNGVREASEGCDDGNTTAGDGCNATCLVETTRACNASAPGLTGNASCASGVCDTVGNTAPGVCEAANACGNGVREAGEGCDDGNTTAGDGCNATCRIETTRACNASAPGLTGNASCASGICDTVGNTAPGVCEAANTCGNGVREAGEGCDDGNTTAGDGCNATCLVENTRACNASAPGLTGNASCASGICDTVGNTAPGVCEPANGCGNGVREAGEGCDDGNTTAGDGCNATCLVENNRACNASAPGLTGNASCASGICDTVGNTAPGVCEPANSCGNGVREAGEGCDDGNITAGDGCNATCLVENTRACNASAPGLTGNASCASGVCDTVGNTAPGVCEPANGCGNGVREAGEGCDDGNTTAGDGCNATCRIENARACNGAGPGLTGNASCASGICDTLGNTAPGVCEAPNVCGNGVREVGEGCDDGNTAAGDGCNASCLVENTRACNASAPGLTGNASCASGLCDTVGSPAPGVCKATNVCGNGAREAGEGCDDGNTTAGDGCSATCLIENTRACNATAPGSTGNASCASGVCDTTGNTAPGVCEPANTCGNGTREASEGCDDGNTTAGDGCNASCLVENTRACNASLPGTTGNASCASGVCDTTGNTSPGVCEPANTCGNGTRETGEGCDDGNTTAGDGCNATCLVENTRACNATAPGLTGNASCASGLCDTVGSPAPGVCRPANACGNGAREAGEGCDDGNTTSGDGCSATCLIENTRACNATAPGNTGASSCASGVCDTTGNTAPGVCEPANTCGNGTRETGEGCDDGNTTAGDGCNATCLVENTRPCNANAPGTTGNASCASGVCDTTGNTSPGVCEPANTCGNGVREAGEGCDDGNTTAGDGCNATCRIENARACNASMPGTTGNASCASGVCDTTGNTAPGVCEAANTCGNGTRETGEGCDDGNTAAGDGCSATCLIENTRACNASTPGSTGNASCASGVCDTTGNTAPGVCEAANVCGNGVREAAEGCDDGNTTAGDGCNATCLVENARACNASMPGLTGNASCASGLCDTVGSPAPGICRASNACGNGVREAGEGCDDGNTTAGDGCNATCLIENTRACNSTMPGSTGNGSCASGVCDTTGNTSPGVCEAANTCGNGVREAGEGCDDGNTAAGDGCSSTCLAENGRACNASLPGATGNGSCASGVCDTRGNAAPGICEAPNVCGNGAREAGEGCDDGNTTAGDGCNAKCLIEDTHACNATTPGNTGNASCASGTCDTSGGAPGTCRGGKDSDGDGINDADDLDDDNDGITDVMEGGPDTDTDGDSVPDRLDLDSDNDGILDAWEAGHTQPISPAGVLVCSGGFGANGLCNALETGPESGRVSYAGNTTETTQAVDTDHDGVPDFRDLDSDNDGILDVMEGGSTCVDADGNGVCDGGDSDGDGLVNGADGAAATWGAGSLQPPPDTDGDGVKDFRDLDSDNDGLTDLDEGDSGCTDDDGNAACDGSDPDGDGLPTSLDRLSTTRGTNQATLPPDTDGDGVKDFRDLDSDDDGLSDLLEGGALCVDADKDGVCDPGDPDGDGLVDTADGDPMTWGSATNRRAPRPDTDGDGTPDFREVDSDGDGVFDIVKAGRARLDGNGDGRIDRGPDVDHDGIRDEVDRSTDRFGGLEPPPGFRVTGGGCGCASSEGGTSGLWFFGLALLVAASRRRLHASVRAAAVVAIVGLVPVAARAQTTSGTSHTSTALDVQQFKPAPGRHDLMNVLSTKSCGAACWNTGLWLQYTRNPLLLADLTNQRVGILVDNQLTADLLHTWGLTDRIDLGFHLPLYVQSTSQSDVVNAKYVGSGWNFGAGDLRVIPRIRFWESQKLGLSLGLALPVVLPTGRTDAFMGGGFIGVQPRLLVGFEKDALRIDANLGFNLRRLEVLANVYVGNEFAWSLAGQYQIIKTGKVPLAVLASLHGIIGLVNSGQYSNNRSTEVDVGLKVDLAKEWGFGLTVGRGIISGYGAPDVRVAANLAFSPQCGPIGPVDTDHDGIFDDVDKCIYEPEDKDGFEDADGCPDPDNDKDGVLDVNDKCPLEKETINGFKDDDGCPEKDTDGDGLLDERDKCPLAAETFNGIADEDGCPEKDSDGDGLFDDVDKCPNAPEDKDGFEDSDGCPDPDNDKDGIPDVVDKCPLVPETINGVEDTDGCPDEGEAKVKLEGGKILILEKVYFATNKDVILARSFNLLTQVSSTLKAHAEIKKVRVEGHTDSQGDDAANLDLSQRRANSVKRFLSENGIDVSRMESVGYGETRPVGANTTPAGREMNRRVEFVVTDIE